MTFPDTNASLRTDAGFLAMIDEDHHHSSSPLFQLNIGLVSDFVLDYMHLVCLGVVRRMLKFWLKGPLDSGIRLQSHSVKQLSQRLENLVNEVPRDFARKPRSIFEIDRWKAVEFRQFLLYSGIAILRGVVSDKVFDHFMLLSVGILLLVHPVYHQTCYNYAHNLLKMFVEQSASIYGPEFVVYNVHCLVHLSADAMTHGSLDSFSAFPFENELKTVKSLVRKAELPLAQVVRRLSEKRAVHQSQQTCFATCVVQCEHFLGPVPKGLEHGRQFRKLRLRNMFIQCSSADNCVVVKDVGPVLIENIIQMQNAEVFLVCQVFCNVGNVFSYPLESSSLSIFYATGLSGKYATFPVAMINTKCVRLPCGKNGSHFTILPLIHFSQ
jgi:hypothetical protein